MAKHTPGPWRLENDAQGPCIVLHPTKHGVAIAALTSAFSPANGFHDPVTDTPEACNEAYGGVTYRSERVANARLIAAAPDLLEAAKEVLKGGSHEGPCTNTPGTPLEAIACEKHLAAAQARKERLRAAIAKAEGR